MHLFLTFSAALGIARTSSALHSLARKLAAARHSPIKQVCRSCSRLAKRATIFIIILCAKVGIFFEITQKSLPFLIKPGGKDVR